MKRFLAVALVAVGLGACAASPPKPELQSRSYDAANELHEMAKKSGFLAAEPGGQATIMVTSIANVDQVDTSSTLGRILGEQLSSRFSQLGHKVIEVKLRDAVAVKEGDGEFILSRNLHELARSHEVTAIVTGTYALGADFAHINIKMINPQTRQLVGGTDKTIPLTSDVASLAQPKKRKAEPMVWHGSY